MGMLSFTAVFAAYATASRVVPREFVRGGLTEMPMRALYMRLGQGTIFSVHPVFPDSQSFPSLLLSQFILHNLFSMSEIVQALLLVYLYLGNGFHLVYYTKTGALANFAT